MADNNTFGAWGAGHAQPNSQIGYDPRLFSALVPGTLVRGVTLRKDANFALLDVVKINSAATLTTGVKVDFAVVDDGADPNDLGKAVVVAAAVKLLTSGTDTLDMTAAAGAEQKATLTLSATKGVVTIGTVTIPTANLDGAAAGNHVLIQLRRIGSDAADTCNGRVILLQATAYAY